MGLLFSCSQTNHADPFQGRIVKRIVATPLFDQDGNFANVSQPTRVLLGNNDDFYVGDYIAGHVLHINLKDSILGYYGSGYGQGPGEAMGIVDFYVDEDSLYTLDARLFRISSFALSDYSYGRSFSVRSNSMRIAGNSDHFFLMTTGADSLIQVYDKSGQETHSLDGIGLPQPQYSMSTSGNLLLGGNGELLYMPMIDGRFFSYPLNDGNPHPSVYISETPDTNRFMPSLSRDANGRTILQPPDTPITRLNVQFVEEEQRYYVFSLFFTPPPVKITSIIDVYDVDLNYLYSLDTNDLNVANGMANKKVICAFGFTRSKHYPDANPMCYTYEIVD